MVFWLDTQVLEDTLLPKPFHVVPILNLAMLDGIVDTVGTTAGGCLSNRFLANVEVEILRTALLRQIAATAAAATTT